MTPEQTNLWLEIQHRQMLALERIADTLERIAPTSTKAPNYQYPLESFTTFDWTSIGATIVQSDQYGAAIVSWRGQQFVRRSPSNKFDPAIWFSRCVGKDDSGENRYERLVTFKPLSKVEVEAIPEKVRRLVG
jgi:hypothetical protein